MITDMVANTTVLWMFITAVIFTFVGIRWTHRRDIEDIVDATITKLIDDGYIYTEGEEIIKYTDWKKDCSTTD